MSFSELFQRKAAGRHVTSDGDEEWYDDQEQLHRDNDLPAQIDSHGGKAWFQHGKIHRDNDKPAIEAANGDRAWYQNDQLHREHGPAVVYADPEKEPEYWLHGRKMSDTERIQRDADVAAAAAKKNGEAVRDSIRKGAQQTVKPLSPIKLRKPS